VTTRSLPSKASDSEAQLRRTGLVETIVHSRLGSLARRIALAGALGGTCLALAILPATANASAYGCTTSGWGLPWYGLNSAYTCLEVGGSGNTVWIAAVNWMGAGTICNYKFQVRWFDDSGRLYETDTSPEHVGCRAAAANWTENFGTPNLWGGYNGVRKHTGQVCGYLIESGSVRPGVPCEYIHP
jgi:hypothetical protein